MGRLDGKVAFITGAGAGIARAAAELFSREGASIVLAEIDESTGLAAEKALRELKRDVRFIHTDVTREESVKEAIAQGVRAFGKLDILYNCAGGSLAEDSLVTDVDLHDVWERTMSVNLLGTMICCRHAIPRIIEAGGGTVVNMSSGAALRGSSPLHVYSAAKARSSR